MEDAMPRIPESNCPWCGHIIDGATHPDDDSKMPSPGDVSACIRCAGLLEFDANLKIVKLPDATLDAMRFNDFGGYMQLMHIRNTIREVIANDDRTRK